MKIENNFKFEVVSDYTISFMGNYNAKIVSCDADPSVVNKVTTFNDAYQISKNLGLDLVIIKKGYKTGSEIIPAIVKILDYNKFIYNEKKKEKENAKKTRQNEQKTKEVKFHINIDSGDYNYKLNHIKEFTSAGDKVNCTIVLRGREATNNTIINSFINKLKEDCSQFSKFISGPTRQGNIISSILVKKD